MIVERFINFRKQLGLTQEQLGQLIGDAKTTADIEREKSELSASGLIRLVKEYGINPLWLYEKNQPQYLDYSSKDCAPKVISLANEESENIVLVNAKAAAGYPQNISDTSWYKQLPAFEFPIPQFRNSTYRGFQIEGDSMLPNLKANDWVLARAVEQLSHINSNKIYVIVLFDSIMVKKINVLESGLYELVSINPEFEPYKISALQIQEVWEVSSRISFGIEEPQDSKLLHQLKESMNLLKQQLEEATLN
jgi:transcriptional regulator with XRE-family HTH domain